MCYEKVQEILKNRVIKFSNKKWDKGVYSSVVLSLAEREKVTQDGTKWVRVGDLDRIQIQTLLEFNKRNEIKTVLYLDLYKCPCMVGLVLWSPELGPGMESYQGKEAIEMHSRKN